MQKTDKDVPTTSKSEDETPSSDDKAQIKSHSLGRPVSLQRCMVFYLIVNVFPQIINTQSVALLSVT